MDFMDKWWFWALFIPVWIAGAIWWCYKVMTAAEDDHWRDY
jgi:hypothetical protein